MLVLPHPLFLTKQLICLFAESRSLNCKESRLLPYGTISVPSKLQYFELVVCIIIFTLGRFNTVREEYQPVNAPSGQPECGKIDQAVCFKVAVAQSNLCYNYLGSENFRNDLKHMLLILHECNTSLLCITFFRLLHESKIRDYCILFLGLGGSLKKVRLLKQIVSKCNAHTRSGILPLNCFESHNREQSVKMLLILIGKYTECEHF